MSGGPTTPPPGPQRPLPPSPPPPYGPPYYPYAYPPPTPKRSNLALIIVVVVVVVVLVPIILAAILYVMVSGLIGAPTQRPIVIFGPVDLTGGNATVSVVSSSQEVLPSNLQIMLRANYSGSLPVGMPPPDGSVVISTGGYLFRVFWLDRDHDQTVGVGDAFGIMGSSAPLPASTIFTFDLRYTDGTILQEVSWTTP